MESVKTPNATGSSMQQALHSVRVLDMSRVLAGPLLAQNLADLGADVIKVERPGEGDETRSFPPFAKDENGNTSDVSAYFSSVNRGKRSITVDFRSADGQRLIRELTAKCDVFIENYKFGTLKQFGLDYDSLSAINPRLIYCSITGYGQTGPYRERPGYDYVFQAMSGLMSLTGGPDGLPGGGPAKVGVAISDVLTGINSSFAVAAALFYREKSGRGQHIDMSLLDVQVAAISHINMNYLVGGAIPKRMGSAHPNIVPYQAFDCLDGQLVVAVGNNSLFAKLCRALGLPDLLTDERYNSNPKRVENRESLVPMIGTVFEKRPVEYWMPVLLDAGVPCGRINSLPDVFDDPQVRARGLQRKLAHPQCGSIPMLANPIRFSETKAQYLRHPPNLGEHTSEVLKELLGMDEAEIDALSLKHVI
jgi:crotonobetainyl-CoA:carnitine CoA-transferase CaiB-like acyl-CoA transferase